MAFSFNPTNQVVTLHLRGCLLFMTPHVLHCTADYMCTSPLWQVRSGLEEGGGGGMGSSSCGSSGWGFKTQWWMKREKRWTPGTPWPHLETGAGPADCYPPPAYRELWSECPSEEDWHFRHFTVWVRPVWPNPRPRPSVQPKMCRETSANMAAGCWSGDQAFGFSRRPLTDGWFCGIKRT